jgi:hypothetical protein
MTPTVILRVLVTREQTPQGIVVRQVLQQLWHNPGTLVREWRDVPTVEAEQANVEVTGLRRED